MAKARTSSEIEQQVKLAVELYKHQNFRASAIKQRVKSDVYQESSVIAFLSLLRKYVHTGEKDLKRACQEFYNTIDQLKQQHYSILRPSEEDEARPFAQHNYGRRASKVVKRVEKQPTQTSTCSKININVDTLQKIKNANTFEGVQIDDCIKLFNNKDVMSGFLSAFSYMQNPPEYKKVKITITEI